LNIARSLHSRHFSLAEVYDRSDELQRLHPNNLHVREKIRQQLQRLRDMGLVEFLGGGRYSLRG
jgi:type II restriction enzyme